MKISEKTICFFLGSFRGHCFLSSSNITSSNSLAFVPKAELNVPLLVFIPYHCTIIPFYYN